MHFECDFHPVQPMALWRQLFEAFWYESRLMVSLPISHLRQWKKKSNASVHIYMSDALFMSHVILRVTSFYVSRHFTIQKKEWGRRKQSFWRLRNAATWTALCTTHTHARSRARIHRQTDRQTDRQTHTHTHTLSLSLPHSLSQMPTGTHMRYLRCPLHTWWSWSSYTFHQWKDIWHSPLASDGWTQWNELHSLQSEKVPTPVNYMLN